MTPMLRTDRDGRPTLTGHLSPSDSRLADWMLGIAIVVLMGIAAWKAEGLEGSVPAQVEETDRVRGGDVR